MTCKAQYSTIARIVTLSKFFFSICITHSYIIIIMYKTGGNLPNISPIGCDDVQHVKENGNHVELGCSPSEEVKGGGKDRRSPLVGGKEPLDHDVMKVQCQQQFSATPSKDVDVQVKIYNYTNVLYGSGLILSVREGGK